MKRVLLVEDDFYIRGLYKMAFEKAGYDVVEVTEGNEAFSKISSDNFDFIVLDLMLPGMPGMDVLKKIKATSKTPVYILTNVGDEQALQEAMKLGADAYFVKVDYTPKKLVAAIEKKETERQAEAPQA